MKLDCTEIWVLTKHLMQLNLFDFCNVTIIKRETLTETFEVMTDLESGVKYIQHKKKNPKKQKKKTKLRKLYTNFLIF